MGAVGIQSNQQRGVKDADKTNDKMFECSMIKVSTHRLIPVLQDVYTLYLWIIQQPKTGGLFSMNNTLWNDMSACRRIFSLTVDLYFCIVKLLIVRFS